MAHHLRHSDGDFSTCQSLVRTGYALYRSYRHDAALKCYVKAIRNLRAMQGKTDAKGREIQIETIQEGSYHPDEWNGGCSSYINAYIANGAVIVPGYDQARDTEAVETWQRVYPEREVVQVQINDIALGGGGIHCITQQQPAPQGGQP